MVKAAMRMTSLRPLLSAIRGRLAPVVSRAVPQRQASSAKSDSRSGDESPPIKFTTSPAYRHQPKMKKMRPPSPWYQPWIILSSTAVFLIYFLVLREENDIDYNMGNKTVQEMLVEAERAKLKKRLRKKLSEKELAVVQGRLEELTETFGPEEE